MCFLDYFRLDNFTIIKLKVQNTNYKLQINFKSQFLKFQTREFSEFQIHKIWDLVFFYWVLFVFCDLIFGVLLMDESNLICLNMKVRYGDVNFREEADDAVA